jgi:hypothetical protein
MDDTLSIGWTQDWARSRRSAYRGLLKLALLIEAAVGAVALVWPYWLASLLTGGSMVAPDWMRAWGVLVLLFCLVQLPGLGDPQRNRGPNVIGIVGRFAQALTYLLVGGPFWFGVVEGVFFLLLAILYYRLCIAELMTRP